MRFVAVLVVGLALMAWATSTLVHRTTLRWHERDLDLRSALAVSGARRALLAHAKAGETDGVREVLEELTRDERILGAAACLPGGTIIPTKGFPASVSCRELGEKLAADAGEGAGPAIYSEMISLDAGDVHVSAMPLVDGPSPAGTVVLVHDLRYIGRREAVTRKFLFGAFSLLAVCASLLTVLWARYSWRDWTDQVRRLIRGDAPHPAFQPIMADVRELVSQLSAERDVEEIGGRWTPERLKQTLARQLSGEKVLIVANREPYIHVRGPDGGVHVQHPASGLVTALEPVMRACSGTWIAHGSGSADRETADAWGRVRVPPGNESYTLRRVWLSREEEQGYYYGLANEGLWPLCHIAHTRPQFRTEDWRYYQKVNRRFADAVVSEVDTEDPIVLVQDYHFALAPAYIRERLPRATILSFWHIPWPNPERYGICPYRDEILRGMLGSSIMGFHTQQHANNFTQTVERFLECRIDRERQSVVHRGRDTLVRPYPISIPWPDPELDSTPPAAACRKAVRAELGLPEDILLGVGVDRLDYIKGIEERLLAVERMLERYPYLKNRFTFVQLAAPSRSAIGEYRKLDETVVATTERINARFARDGWRPIILFRAHHEHPAIFRYYRAADVCYVSSLHDGMNLVAKEFVAARDDERGVLVLSHFTGAARELTQALIVNPYDLDEASSALATALRMPLVEQADRMRAMRSFVAEFNVYRWAGRMLVDAAHLRRQERLTGRLGSPRPVREEVA
jgi:trehalose 6-phosphate synthase